jgi:hypothetical protein
MILTAISALTRRATSAGAVKVGRRSDISSSSGESPEHGSTRDDEVQGSSLVAQRTLSHDPDHDAALRIGSL